MLKFFFYFFLITKTLDRTKHKKKMARKKSAAKKARESEGALKKQTQDVKDNKNTNNQLIDGSDDDDDEIIENKLEINQEYAKRFEHNKKREAEHRKQEKEEVDDEEEESSSSEEEDDYGDLLTEDIDTGINEVLKTIRENPNELLNKDKNYFGEIPQEGELYHKTKQNSMNLRDYHRKNLLGQLEEKDTYAGQQEANKQELLNEIDEMDVDDEENEDDGDFMVKKDKPAEEDNNEDDDKFQLPDYKENANEFLNQFISKKAWLPTKKESMELEDKDDDDEFDNIADTYEQAYNFRFEDPEATEIVSYARNQNTIRRAEESSRKRQREKKKEVKKLEEKEQQQKVNKVKKQKTSEVMNKLEKLKKEVGDEIGEMFNDEDFEGEFDDTEWDQRMKKLFNDDFYSKKEKLDGEPDEQASEHQETETRAAQEDNNDDDEEQQMSKTKKRKLEKQKERQEKQHIKQKAEEFVDKNIDLVIDESIKPNASFRYREVSPDTFGLTAKDILCADDKQLNSFVGLKKLAEYRDPESKKKDRRKYAKSKRVRGWRKEAFNNEQGPTEDQVSKIFK